MKKHVCRGCGSELDAMDVHEGQYMEPEEQQMAGWRFNLVSGCPAHPVVEKCPKCAAHSEWLRRLSGETDDDIFEGGAWNDIQALTYLAGEYEGTWPENFDSIIS